MTDLLVEVEASAFVGFVVGSALFVLLKFVLWVRNVLYGAESISSLQVLLWVVVCVVSGFAFWLWMSDWLKEKRSKKRKMVV